MSTVTQTNRKFMIEFIRYYKSLPSLWNNKCPDYRHQPTKDKAYFLLLKKYRETCPKATLQDLKRKINSLRSNFRRCYQNAKNTGSPSKVFWYKELSFILGDEPILSEIDVEASYLELQSDPLPMELNVSETCDNSSNLDNATEDSELCIEESEHYVNTDQWQESAICIEESTPKYKKIKSEKFTPQLKYKEEHLENVCTPSSACNIGNADEYDYWGKVVAVELKKMEPMQQIFAKKAISEILMEGQLGLLSKDSVQLNKKPEVRAAAGGGV